MPKKASRRVKKLKSFMEWAEQFNDGEYVFRGVSNEKYIIEASTYRRLKDKDGKFKKEDRTPEKLLKINEEMIEEARRQGHGRDLKDLELLAELQHRGAATCLIDFTKNPLVALWMACRESSGSAVNGKVFAMDISSQITFQPVTSKLSQEENIRYFLERDENERYQLYQWQPNYQNNRMLAQQSIFLFGGAEIESVSECIILKNSKQNIRNSLEKSTGITEGSLFPDFDGFASQRAQNKTYIEPDAQYYFIRGLQAFTEGKIDEVIDYYSKGISLNPDRGLLTILHISRAHVNERIENYSLALEDYNKVIELTPDYPGHYLDRGLTMFALERYEEAVADYDKFIHQNANEMLAYHNRGLAKDRLGQYKEAISDYNEAIRLDPDYASSYNERGFTKDKLGQHFAAIADFDTAIQLKSDYVRAYVGRGLVRFGLEQYEKAIADFDEAISLDPNNTPIYYQRALARTLLEQYEVAIADYDTVIRLDPNYAHAYYYRAYAKFHLGRFNEARVDLRAALPLAVQAEEVDFVVSIEQLLREIDSASDGGDSEDE